MTTLKVKNISGSELTLETEDGDASRTIDADEIVELGAIMLRAQDFKEALERGDAEFQEVESLDEDQLALGRSLMGKYLPTIGRDLVVLRKRIEQSIDDLERLKPEYNAAWERAKAVLDEGAASGDETRNLRAAARGLLGYDALEKRIATLEADIDGLELEVDSDSVTEAERDEYFTDRTRLEKQLARAKSSLESIEKTTKSKFDDMLDDLESAAEYFDAIDSSEIGDKLDWEVEFDDPFETP